MEAITLRFAEEANGVERGVVSLSHWPLDSQLESPGIGVIGTSIPWSPIAVTRRSIGLQHLNFAPRP